MKYLYSSVIIAALFFVGEHSAYAQDSTALLKFAFFPDKVFKQINAKSASINKQLLHQSNKYMDRMAKTEQKLRRKLSRTDSAAGDRIFGDTENKFAVLHQIKNFPGNVSGSNVIYLPHIDSLQTALKLLDMSEVLYDKNLQTVALLKKALHNIDVMQQSFKKADQVKKHMMQRSQFLQDQLARYGLKKDLKKLQKQAYYYRAQVEAYQHELNNPSYLEARALAMLSTTSFFKNFFREHSQLAGLFRLPESSLRTPLAGFAGFQTRETIQEQLSQRFGALPDFQQMATHKVGEAQSQLNVLKNKISKLSTGNADTEISGFKPDNQKTKSFMKRLELGTNLQTVKSNNFFPSTSDIALSLGYRLNDKSTIGIGSSYKMGWGKDIRHLSITHQGIGLRSFVDVKIKGSFWISGGAEMNYRSQFSNFEILNDYTPWQKSALLGVSKKYRVSSKLKGTMQLLYDCLYKLQVPRTQPVVFRVGYIW